MQKKSQCSMSIPLMALNRFYLAVIVVWEKVICLSQSQKRCDRKITKQIGHQGYKTCYIKVTDLFNYIKNTYKHESSINEMKILKRIDDLALLVLDDIGSEYVKVNEYGYEIWAAVVLYKVFDMRL